MMLFTRQSRNDFFFVHSAHLTLTCACLKDAHKKNRPDNSKNTPACYTKFPDLVLTKITFTFLNLTSDLEQTIKSLVSIQSEKAGLWPCVICGRAFFRSENCLKCGFVSHPPHTLRIWSWPDRSHVCTLSKVNMADSSLRESSSIS